MNNKPPNFLFCFIVVTIINPQNLISACHIHPGCPFGLEQPTSEDEPQWWWPLLLSCSHTAIAAVKALGPWEAIPHLCYPCVCCVRTTSAVLCSTAMWWRPHTLSFIPSVFSIFPARSLLDVLWTFRGRKLINFIHLQPSTSRVTLYLQLWSCITPTPIRKNKCLPDQSWEQHNPIGINKYCKSSLENVSETLLTVSLLGLWSRQLWALAMFTIPGIKLFCDSGLESS